MEDSCAVCAEVAEWVAYGECGHVDVCAVCIARFRFVCHDRRCCICMSPSPFVFVTKALGSLTRVINDFSVLPANAKDGKVGSYWFLEGIQAYFDDFHAYKIVQDMCRLSCTVCDKSEAEGKQTTKRKNKIKDVEQLEEHLSRQHELFYCSLCLANRKVFICEQKLYNRAQLGRHLKNGDSEVDGFESERCGFSGHPYCEFCQTPFYGDNDLFSHMSTEHFTCHICTSENPTKYEYYVDYNDMEIHFREGHFLCEDGECLELKFMVFATEAEIKSHAASEHGDNMACYKRNAALQERADGAGVPSKQILSATSSDAGTSSSLLQQASSSVHRAVGHIGVSDNSLTTIPMPSSGPPRTALDFRGVLLNGPQFPQLPSTSKRRRHKSKKNSQETVQNTVDLLNNSTFGSLNSGNGSHSAPAASPLSMLPTAGHSTSSSSVNRSNHLNLTSSSISKHVGSPSSAFDFVDGGSMTISACGEGIDAQAANKSLMDSIHVALKHDRDKFSAFRIISKQYRDGAIKTGEYLSCVDQFGLGHLIADLAKLCPDQQKQKELMEISKSRLGGFDRTDLPTESSKTGGCKNTKKGKEKCQDSEISKPLKELSSSDGVDHTAKGKLKIPAITEIPKILPSESQSKNVANTSAVTKMPKIFPPKSQSKDAAKTPAVSEMPKVLPVETRNKAITEVLNFFQSAESGAVTNTPAVMKSIKILRSEPESEVVIKTPAVTKTSEILPKHSKSKAKAVGCSNDSVSNCGQSSTTAAGGKKRVQKTPKFLRIRLSESAASTVPTLKISEVPSDLMVVRPNEDSILASVRGVWRNGGGRRLVTLTEASPCSR